MRCADVLPAVADTTRSAPTPDLRQASESAEEFLRRTAGMFRFRYNDAGRALQELAAVHERTMGAVRARLLKYGRINA